jgi:hypothetical protein
VNPWSIIGWIVLGAMGVSVLVACWFALETMAMPWLWARWHHLRSRAVSPTAQQMWMQGKTRLTIKRVADNGRIVMTTGNASWSDSLEEWQDRVKSRRLWLLRDAPREERKG